jgi:hypothetical protein
MSLISSVTGAAAALATGLDHVTTTPVTTGAPTSAGQRSPLAAAAAGTSSPLRSDSLTLKLAAAKARGLVAARVPARSRARGPSSRTTTRARTSGPRAGYATGSTGGDFAFLRDPTLSVEEKLFRFMCAIAKRNDDEVLKKMEEMKGGASKATSSSGGSTGKKRSSGFSVWGALKVMIPALGITAKVLGDAQLKSLVTQLSGPVLAGAATALGLPMLAPLALSVGPKVVRDILDGKLDAPGPADGGEPGGGSSPGTPGGTPSTPASGKNEQVQLMELQRLIDKQKEMFAMVSNILRAQHDTRMSIIGNVR